MGKGEILATIWEIPDHLWEQIQPVIAEIDPAKAMGRKRADPRRMLDDLEGIVFRPAIGCQGNRLPGSLGDDSTIHRTFQRWVALGVLERIWATLVDECEELGGVEWEWQAADCAMGKASFGGCSRPQPHGPGQGWQQGERLGRREGRADERGRGRSQRHDTKLLRQTLENIVVEHRHGADESPKNLCLDKGYDNPMGRGAASEGGYPAHIRRIGEEKVERQQSQALSNPPVGGGTHAGMAVQEPGGPGAL